MDQDIKQGITTYLFKRYKFGPASIRSISAEVGVSAHTIKKHIVGLVEKGRVYEQNIGNRKEYGLSDKTFNLLKDIMAFEDINLVKTVKVGYSASQHIIRIPSEISYCLGAKPDSDIDFTFNIESSNINKGKIIGGFVIQIKGYKDPAVLESLGQANKPDESAISAEK